MFVFVVRTINETFFVDKVTEDIPTSKEQDNALETQKQINEVQIQQMQHAHKSESDRLTQHWTLERNQLLKQLHSAEMRSFALEQAEEFTESFLPRNNVEVFHKSLLNSQWI